MAGEPEWLGAEQLEQINRHIVAALTAVITSLSAFVWAVRRKP